MRSVRRQCTLCDIAILQLALHLQAIDDASAANRSGLLLVRRGCALRSGRICRGMLMDCFDMVMENG